ncbi:unnamed protein product [Adineta ricciae]|uniref:U2A'/phosphoprotein 32 family A C-terminal domain-containing protein n=2 Tax=Adineta ricciae TaxID=249248 RepID=A0A813RPE2_ADIRI|nr:unnamed protein product [Adineta ricciae]
MKSVEDENILKDICESNGINYNALQRNSGIDSNIQILEMFFSGLPRLISLQPFPNLFKLVIVNQNIEHIEGLDTCVNLRELWITECKLTVRTYLVLDYRNRIEGLSRCSRLQRLYLYANAITTIEHLNGLQQLEHLWLNENLITKIEGLASAKHLKDLNLASNQIKYIGMSLAENTELEVLNLADNKISSFQDITLLTALPKLRNIAFSDPVYGGKSPVASMANYHVHILYHLPHLEYIDGVHISTRQVAEQAEATVTKKKMWYHMKSKTLEREYDEFETRLKQLRKRNEHIPEEHIRSLIRSLQQLKQELHLPEKYQRIRTGGDNKKEKIEKQIDILRQRVVAWQNILNTLTAQYETAHFILLQQKAQLASRIQLELISGGNIRFEEGTVNDVWYNATKDLLLSRFCSSIYNRYNITGIKIHRITRLFNRPKKLQFDHNLDYTLEEEEDSIKTKSIQSKLEYLFYTSQPSRHDQNNHMHQFTTIESISEHGFPNVELYKAMGQEEAIPFSNSLAVSDYLRIEQAGFHNRDKYRFGSVLLAKVYIGSSTTLPKKELPFPEYQADSSISSKNFPIQASVTRHVTFPERTSSKTEHCDCGGLQQQWFVFDPLHAYAEYIIEYEYLFSVANNTLSDQLSRIKLGKLDELTITNYNEEVHHDNSILPSKDEDLSLKIDELNEEILLEITHEKNLANIVELNLACCNLHSIKFLSNLKNLRSINLAFNELVKLDELCYFYSLESIDLSYNKLVTFDGMKGLTKLIYLIATNNFLKKSLDEVLTVKRYCPNVKHLDLRGNPFDKPETYRPRSLALLPNLLTLDGMNVSPSEREDAQECQTDVSCSLENFILHSRIYPFRPRDLRSYFIAKYYDIYTNDPLGIHQPKIDDIYWMSKVTSLCLNDVYLTQLPDLSNMICLRWASFDNNCLTKIQGLDNLVKLEELSIENNFLKVIDGIDNLLSLSRLNVSKNDIADIEGQVISNLPRLSYLALDHNRLHSLAKLNGCSTLIELYAGNNLIKNIRDIFHLKSLSNLLILDLWGNPICHEADKYRLFIIYHLKSLRAFDGFAVEIQESGEARETFGGKLTADFIVEKLGNSNFSDIKHLELPQSSIRGVELNAQFPALKCVNLEHNQLTSFSGLIHLPNLKVLCLNYNRVESILPRPTKPRLDHRGKPIPENVDNRVVLENLEVLHLAYNNISDLIALQLNKIPSLRSLFLQGNEITKVEGLEALRHLRELVLDKNKIRLITETSFYFQTNLVELHLEENRIRELTFFDRMMKLEKLFLGSNKVTETQEIEKLSLLVCLNELSLTNNPVSRKSSYRFFVTHKLPQVQILDEQLITEDERFRAEIYYTESAQQGASTGNVSEYFPGFLSSNPQQTQQQQQQPMRINQLALNDGYGSSYLIDQIRHRQMQIRAAAANIGNSNGKNDEHALINEINYERVNLGLKPVQMHLTLQLAAEKRCSNRDELLKSYEKMLSNTYRTTDWPREEHLNEHFPLVSETLYLYGETIHAEIFRKFFFLSNMYRVDYVYIGISTHEYKNLSAGCILNGSSRNSISHHRRLLRLLYILISCGIVLLSLIICSIMNDRRRAKLEKQQEELTFNKQVTVPQKSMTVYVDKDRKSSARRGDPTRLTMARLQSIIDERPSAIHNFSPSSNVN